MHEETPASTHVKMEELTQMSLCSSLFILVPDQYEIKLIITDAPVAVEMC